MATKKSVKKMKVMKAVGVGAGVAAGLAAALAGAYLLYEDKGKRRQAKAWVTKAKKEAAREIKMMRRVGEKEYKMAVEKAMKHYGSLENVNMADVMKAVSDAKNEWKRIKGQVEKMVKAPKTSAKKPAKKSVKRHAHRKAKKAKK
jgi:hypothetical protein